MPNPSAEELSPEILDNLGISGARDNTVVSLLTVDARNFPNVCLLSPFQVLASSPRTVHFLVYGGSGTEKNLARHDEATLAVFIPPGAFYIKGRATMVKPQPRHLSFDNSLYKLDVSVVTKDLYEKAPITSAPTFDGKEVLADYSRAFSELVNAAAER